MRYLLLVMTPLFTLGCVSNQVIERDLSHVEILTAQKSCSGDCSVEVSYHEHHEFTENETNESLLTELRRQDVKVRLSDSTAYKGRLLRLSDSSETWVLYRRNSDGSLIDTVQFRASAVETATVVRTLQGRKISADRTSITVDGDKTLPLSSVDNISLERRRRRMGSVWIPATLGALAGGALGLLAGKGKYLGEECKDRQDRSFLCLDPPPASLITGPLGLLLGGGLGVLLGKTFGSTKVTVYRFRPDTPQQMSVVIGVGPTKGGAR